MSGTTFAILAGIKPKSFAQATNGIDIASARYADSIKQQSKQCSDMLTAIIQDIDKMTPDILYEALEPTFEKSKEYCPKKTGALVASAFLEKQDSAHLHRVIMGYAKGGEPPYAVLVHERVDINHQAPTRAKFLLAALEEDAGDIYQRIVEAMTIQ